MCLALRLSMLAAATTLASPLAASALSAGDISGSWSLGAEARGGALFACAAPLKLAAADGGRVTLAAPGWTETFTWIEQGEPAGLLKPLTRSSSGYLISKRPDGALRWQETDADGNIRPNIDSLMARRCTQG